MTTFHDFEVKAKYILETVSLLIVSDFERWKKKKYNLKYEKYKENKFLLKFIDQVEKYYNFSAGPSLYFEIIVFSYLRYNKEREIYPVFSKIINGAAVNDWFSREDDFHRHWARKMGITPTPITEITDNPYDLEEEVRGKFHNTPGGFFLCQDYTSGYSESSEYCCDCKFSKDCS